MKKELALSEDSHFVPFLTREVVENFLKAPIHFSLQRFHSTVSQDDLLTVYEKIFNGSKTKKPTLIGVIQPLAKDMLGMTDFSKQTKRISEDARVFRDLFFSAKTPVDLLLVDLPRHFEFEVKDSEINSKHIEIFEDRVRAALAELRGSYHKLQNQVIDELKKAFNLPKKINITSVRESLKRLNGLDKYTIDPHCKAFISRLVDPHGEDQQWLVSFCSFIARKPPEKWLDEDFEAAKYRLAELASRELDLRSLQFHYQNTGSAKREDYEANLIRLISSRDGDFEKIVMVDNVERQRLVSQVSEVKKALQSLPNDEARFAAIALVLRDLMPRRKMEEFESENTVVYTKNKDVA